MDGSFQNASSMRAVERYFLRFVFTASWYFLPASVPTGHFIKCRIDFEWSGLPDC